jgi:hypothetical protein
MSKTGLQTANQQRNLAHWGKQIADCRSSGQTVAQWCSAHGIPKSTYYTWQRKLYEVTVSASDTFVEVPLAPQPISRISVATVSMSGVTAEIHNGADEATLAALFRAMKSC